MSSQETTNCTARSIVRFPDGSVLSVVPFMAAPLLGRDEWLARWMKVREEVRRTIPGSYSQSYTNAAEEHFKDYQARHGRCHDCNVRDGGFHHPGCDAERCPRCDGQLIGCGCLDERGE